MNDQPIRVGQVWERLRDGTHIVITGYSSFHDDCRYNRIGHKSRQDIYGFYLRRYYRLVQDPANLGSQDAENEPDGTAASCRPAPSGGAS